MPVRASDLVITGVVDGPLSGGLPKAIELCVLSDISDLSDYGVGSANNGGGSDGEEFTFPAGAVSAGTFLYVASEASGFSTFFGFAPQYTSGAALINGDDAIELFMSGGVVDVFGDINVDGTGEAWEYLDGWTYRDDGTGPDGTTFVLANWSFSGPNALDGEASNGTATTPFPIGAYSACELPEPVPDLLLSEIVVTPTAGEFIEIHNPTAVAIDLSDVYLTDATFAGGGVFYYNIVTGASAGGGGFSDFHARFPDGATIAPGEFQTVSLAGSDDFFTSYGFDPTYELFEDGVGADAVPDMREALPGSIFGQGGLSNDGEVVILYTWDGTSDLVQDIDYALWGDAAEAVDKTGVSVDGPDGDAVASAYLADTAIAIQDVISGGSHVSGDSFQRVDFSEGFETQSGGNGLTGSDETSEDLSVTWELASATPGAGPPPPPVVAIVINEIIQNPAAVSDNNGEWFEVVNATPDPVDIDGWTIKDNGSNLHVITSGGPLVIPAGGFLVLGRDANTGSNGGVAIDYQYSNVFLGNGSDALILLDTSLSEVDRVEWDNGATFPDPTGASMALASPALDNNVGVNWCISSTPFGDGDLGTPGAINDCPPPVINEIIQNPAAVSDGNGEWFEVFNPSGRQINLNGWTIKDDGSNSHVIDNGGPLLVPAGGYLVLGRNANSGTNGGVSVDYQYSDFFLGNSDDEIVLIDPFGNEVDRVEYDGGPAFPDPTGASMALLIPGFDNNAGANWCTSSTPFGDGDLGTPGAVNDCAGTPEIYDLQGSGAFSPFEDLAVITRDNVVTGVRDNGFFMQTPVVRDDFDATTSNGIFVFTNGAPGVAEGDLVTIVGTVVEFFSFTEFDDDGLSIIVTSTGALPAPVLLDGLNPDPGPFDPPDMERFEGMLVQLANGIATGPTDFFGDTAVTVGPARTFREPGIEFPSLFLGPPVWDGNQEVFEVDPNGLAGMPDADIFATQAVSAIGPLAFSFGDYQILPKTLILGPDPTILSPVRERNAGEFTVGSFNLFRLNGGFAKLSAYVIDVLRSPDILAVQEVADIDELEELADQIALDDPAVVYTPDLIEGNDFGGIDVGFLTRGNIQVDTVTQVDPNLTFVNPVTLEDNILHDRPPLLLEGSCQDELGSFPVAVMAVHNRSLGSIEDPIEGVRVRKKRFLQAVSIAKKVEELQTADPNVHLVVTGDFNAFEFTDGYVDAVGVITGDFNPVDNLVCDSEDCTDLPDNALFDEALGVPADERYSFVFGGNAQVLDHALTSVALESFVRGLEYGRGNADSPASLIDDGSTAERSSDHDGLVLFLMKDFDGDGVAFDLDVCAGTVIPESVPTRSLGVNRWALTDSDGAFDTILPNGNGPGLAFDLGDTAGCSCEQIIEAQGLGKGHTKFGCSISAMQDWVALVNP